MKENTLRKMIRTQIKSSLKEAPMARTAVGTKLGSVEKMAGVKMLKKALGQGTPAQQAAGLLQVVQSISGDNPTTGKMLARMLMKGGIAAPEVTPEPVPENYTPGVDDGIAQSNEAGNSVEEGALDSRLGKVDSTQAMKMLKKTLSTKPSTQQVDFVIGMINGLGLKDSAKKRLLLKMRKGLE